MTAWAASAFLAFCCAPVLAAAPQNSPQQSQQSQSASPAQAALNEPLSQQTGGVSTPEEAEVAKRMDAAADVFLASFLGPGRAKVLVTVEGERSRTHTQTEIITPITLPSSLTTVNTSNSSSGANSVPQEPQQQQQQQPRSVDMPGYAEEAVGLGPMPGLPGTPPAATAPPSQTNSQVTMMPHFDFFQRDQEETSRVSGFIIKKLKVTCVLDSKLSDSQASTAAKLLPDLFHIDSSRGDELTIVRADMMPYWKATLHSYLKYLQDPQSMRTELRVAAAALLILLLALAAYLTASRLVKRFMQELAQLRREREDSLAALEQEKPEEAVPELEGDGIPDLIEAGVAEEGEEGKPKEETAPALGRRFDFLSKKPAAELGKLLLTETPQDLALLFGYLTETDPETATTMFSAMPQSRQMAVSRAMSGLTMADPERLAMVETRLRNIVDYGIHGAGRLGDILSRLPLTERDALLNDLMTSNPQAAEEINRALFSFEDIGGLKPTDLRRLIMAVTYPDWGLALRGAPQEMVDRILEQLLPGTQNLIREAMETPQPRSKVLEARSKVLAQAYEMAGRGELVLAKENSSDLV